MNGSAETYASVKQYYGAVLQKTTDLKTSACTAAGRPHAKVRRIIQGIPDDVVSRFYGCGAPLPLGIDALRVLDLGCGSGRDCFVASALVGEHGHVTGVDMTTEQLEEGLFQVARRNAGGYAEALGYHESNMEFIEGHIEFLDRAGIKDSSQDLIISNCVVNLSPDKARVLREAYRVLDVGGEFHFSDVYCDRRVSEAARKNEVLWGECISGALYVGDFMALAKSVGFSDPRVLSKSEIKVHDPQMRALLGNARFYSITYRLFKLTGLLEPACEDYGQVAVYKGTIDGHEFTYQLDQGHTFETGRPALVCGNTAAMLGEGGKSWLRNHFQIIGDRTTHFGAFDCSVTGTSTQSPVESEKASSCKPGSCC